MDGFNLNEAFQKYLDAAYKDQTTITESQKQQIKSSYMAGCSFMVEAFATTVEYDLPMADYVIEHMKAQLFQFAENLKNSKKDGI